LRSGDDFALNEIMHRYKERVYRLAWRYVGNEDAALDVTQETFTKLYFNIDKYDPAYKFSTWLFQIAVNLCRDYLRKNKNHARNVSFDALSESGQGDWQRSDENIEAGFLIKTTADLAAAGNRFAARHAQGSLYPVCHRGANPGRMRRNP
jgi:RNA polymerase sigma factor (sigma-70 family)